MSGPVVDVHAHVDVPALAALVAGAAGLAAEIAEQTATFGAESTRINAELAATTYRPLLDDLDARLAAMDAGGVRAQVVSVVPVHYHYWAARDLAARIVAAANDRVLTVVAARPSRLFGLATVALQHPRLAARQLRDAAAAGLRGVQISTRVGGLDLSDPGFDPFWAVAEELATPVFLHPYGCSLGARLAVAYLGNVIGQPVETTVALHHLVFGGVFDRFPSLRICAAHGGGYFPHYLERADHAYRVRPESRTMARPPSGYLGHLSFDSVVYTPEALARLVGLVGADRVLLGTDYPFDMGIAEPRRLVEQSGLSADEQALVLGGNAERLLSLPTT